MIVLRLNHLLEKFQRKLTEQLLCLSLNQTRNLSLRNQVHQVQDKLHQYQQSPHPLGLHSYHPLTQPHQPSHSQHHQHQVQHSGVQLVMIVDLSPASYLLQQTTQ